MKKGTLLLLAMLLMLTSARYAGIGNTMVGNNFMLNTGVEDTIKVVAGTGVSLTFGGPNCIRTTGLCFNNSSQTTGFSPPPPGYKATAFVNAGGHIVFDITMSDLPADVFYEQFKDNKFYQTAPCPFDPKILAALGVQDTTQTIASGEYPISIVNNHVQIIF